MTTVVKGAKVPFFFTMGLKGNGLQGVPEPGSGTRKSSALGSGKKAKAGSPTRGGSKDLNNSAGGEKVKK
jgi:hypothetical protein